MIGPIRTPLLTAVYALIGVGAAVLWIRFGLWWFVILATVCAMAAAVAIERLADKNVTAMPTMALSLYEARAGVVGVVSALVGGLVVLVTLWAAELAGSSDPDKTLVTTATAALTSLISGVFVSVKDTDEAVGKHVRDEFRTRFEEDARIPKQSDVEKAIYTDYEGGWTDWSRANRKKRIEKVQEYLDALPK